MTNLPGNHARVTRKRIMTKEIQSGPVTKKPRKFTVTVVLGPETLSQVEQVVQSQVKRSSVGFQWSVSDTVGHCVNLGLAEMGRVLLGSADCGDGQCHVPGHAPGEPCVFGCSDHKCNHYA